MHQRISQTLVRAGYLAPVMLCAAVNSIRAAAGELSVDDFKIDGPREFSGTFREVRHIARKNISGEHVRPKHT